MAGLSAGGVAQGGGLRGPDVCERVSGGPRSARIFRCGGAQPSAYVGAVLGGDVVAVGRAVADDGWAGLFGMATLPHARGQRAGRSVLAALAEWAAAHDASRLYLQVECDNIPALRLYEGAGFGEMFRYHYRIAGGTSEPVHDQACR